MDFDNQIHIKDKTVNDPSKREKGTGYKKPKKIYESKVFEGGKTDKNILAPNKQNKDILMKKKW